MYWILTTVAFVTIIATVVVAITDPVLWNTDGGIITLELVSTTRLMHYTHTYTQPQSTHLTST